MTENKGTETAPTESTFSQVGVERFVICDWKRFELEPPKVADEYYLFGGYDSYGSFVFNKYHFSLDFKINGWNIETAIKNGNLWWCLPNEPSGI